MFILLNHIVLPSYHIYLSSIIILLINIIRNGNPINLLKGDLPKAILLSSGKYFIINYQGLFI